VLGSWNLENDTTHGPPGTTKPYIAADSQPTNQVSAGKVNGEVTRHAQHPRICYSEDVGHVGKDVTAPVEFIVNDRLLTRVSHESTCGRREYRGRNRQ